MHLAHNEKTRAPVETHMARPLKYVFWDLLSIEAESKVEALHAEKKHADVSKNLRKRR
jgi:hypothetical protein